MYTLNQIYLKNINNSANEIIWNSELQLAQLLKSPITHVRYLEFKLKPSYTKNQSMS